jgi:WD40 repeat protein
MSEILESVAHQRRPRRWQALAAVGLAAIFLCMLGTVWRALATRKEPLPLLATLKAPDRWFFPLEFSPDGKTLATRSPAGGITLWDVATRKVRAEPVVGSDVLSAVFSPDGRTIAARGVKIGGVSSVVVFDASTGTRLLRVPIEHGYIAHVWYSRDGTTLNLIVLENAPQPNASVVTGGTFRSWESATWKERPARPFRPRPKGVLAFSPDGRFLAAAEQPKSAVVLWDLETEETVAKLTCPVSARTPSLLKIWSLAFSTEGSTLAVGMVDGAIHLWDVPSRRLSATRRVHSPEFVPQFMLIAPGSNLLSSGARYMGPSTLRQQAGLLISRITGMRPPAGPAGECVVCELDTGRVLLSTPDEVVKVLSPDGRTVATACYEGIVRLRDLGPRTESKGLSRP